MLWEEKLDGGRFQLSNKISDKERENIISELFNVSQLYHLDDFGLKISTLEARYKSQSSELFSLTRKRENLLIKKEKESKRSVKQIEPKKIKEFEKGIKLINEELEKKYPEYKDFLKPPILNKNYVQKKLQNNQAFLYFLVSDQWSYTFLIKHNSIDLYIIPLPKKEMNEAVKYIRQGLTQKSSIENYFNFEASSILYNLIFTNQGLLEKLDNINHLIIVPDGPLWALPFSALSTNYVKEESQNESPNWLIDKYSISYLPTVGSLKTLSESKISKKATDNFIGFGNPNFFFNANSKLRSILTRAGKNLDGRYPQLPNTADELLKIAFSLGSNEESVFLGERATEKNVKEAKLNNKKIIAFATHAEVSGAVKGIYEPFILLTQPTEISEIDNGRLTASEISFLNLNASWIILSACNTARDFNLNAYGLSALARSFFYAGSETLLVSHWYVDTVAAEKITTGIFSALSSNTNLNKAEAHKISLLNLKEDKKFSHPYFWAPFVVIGKSGKL